MEPMDDASQIMLDYIHPPIEPLDEIQCRKMSPPFKGNKERRVSMWTLSFVLRHCCRIPSRAKPTLHPTFLAAEFCCTIASVTVISSTLYFLLLPKGVIQ